MICDNADDIDLVPVDAFVLHNTSDFVACDELPRVDLMLWKECSGMLGKPIRHSGHDN